MSASQSNIQARQELTRKLLGQLNAGEAEQALFGHAVGIEFTYEGVQEAYKRVWDSRGRGDAEALLYRHGVAHIRELPKSMYKDFIKYANVSYYYQISPQYAWTNDYDVPTDMRGRWLLHHEGSDSFVVSTNKFDAHELLEKNPDLTDVTGVEHFEREFEIQEFSSTSLGEEML